METQLDRWCWKGATGWKSGLGCKVRVAPEVMDARGGRLQVWVVSLRAQPQPCGQEEASLSSGHGWTQLYFHYVQWEMSDTCRRIHTMGQWAHSTTVTLPIGRLIFSICGGMSRTREVKKHGGEPFVMSRRSNAVVMSLECR